MSHYKHLTPSEREKIYLLHAQNYSLSFISNSIGRNKSTVSRELTRNSNKDSYSPSAAQAAYACRRKQCKPKLKRSDPVYAYVRDRFLKHQWSPEETAGRLSLENMDQSVSYTTIYRAIYAGMFDTKEQRASHGNRRAIRQLRHRGKTRQTKDHLEKRGKISISHAIADRPAEANNRCRLGDWEADTVIGKKAGPCLVTLTDRKSRFLLSQKAEKKASVEVHEAMLDWTALFFHYTRQR